MSQYNKSPDEAYGVRNLMKIVGKRIKMQGFIVRSSPSPSFVSNVAFDATPTLR